MQADIITREVSHPFPNNRQPAGRSSTVLEGPRRLIRRIVAQAKVELARRLIKQADTCRAVSDPITGNRN
jgi:hypothetical protein